jgi:hypothetical protein
MNNNIKANKMKKRMNMKKRVKNKSYFWIIVILIILLLIIGLVILNIFMNNKTPKDNSGLGSVGINKDDVGILGVNEITGCGVILDQANTVYTLGNDIIKNNMNPDSSCINITAPGITLDCQNKRMRISGIEINTIFHAIYSNQPYTTIKNCDIVVQGPNSDSIYLNGANHSKIIYNNFNSIVAGTYYSNIEYNKMIEKTGRGIILGGGYNKVSNNIFSKSNGSIVSIFSNNNITDNVFYNNYISSGIRISSGGSNNIISYNLFSNNNILLTSSIFDNYQIWVDNNCSYNTIKNNEIINNKGVGIMLGSNFYVRVSKDIIISNNFIYNNNFSGTYGTNCKSPYFNFDCSPKIGNDCRYAMMEENITGTGNIINSSSNNINPCINANGNAYWPILGKDYSADINSCVPDCHRYDGTLKTCGSNGCGNLDGCGSCPLGQGCEFGKCVEVCTPNCIGKGCNDYDGCGQTCGCEFGKSCVNNKCEVLCSPKTCSDYSGKCGAQGDGCGGCFSCTCSSGKRCSNGLCIDDSICISNPALCDSGADKCSQGPSDCLMFDSGTKNGLWDNNELLTAIQRWVNNM